ncbi:YfgM family protein [Limnobacter parvus]|uniref:Ancillary SecYEG translocon subunit n=1 Tax=Limnobacter parvus TaxID=2939690 RepID=A0ABT1XHQ8_9BURK|nr:tetratricopeptide repeat protein [Limnobacter parvus]MCR2746810.1 tetratricopeptide repeat protein [Limnobacter parvus]
MSRYSLEEQEQLASLKSFWDKYGSFILTVLILVFGAFAIHNGWKWWQARQSTDAVLVYEQLEAATREGNLDLVGEINKTLIEEHAGSQYAQRGALISAKAYFDEGKLDEAKAALQWAAEEAKLDEYAATARLMLSAILIEQSDFEGAKAALNESYPGFEGLFHDRLGDLALAQKDIATARKEYELAQSTIQADSPWKQVIERKISALPKTGDQVNE